jgi:hypothetical protein
MTNKSELEADGLNQDKMAMDVRAPSQGVHPYFFEKPKRKRGFYRALKAGAPWALVDQAMKDIQRRMLESLLGVFDPQEKKDE